MSFMSVFAAACDLFNSQGQRPSQTNFTRTDADFAQKIEDEFNGVAMSLTLLGEPLPMAASAYSVRFIKIARNLALLAKRDTDSPFIADMPRRESAIADSATRRVDPRAVDLLSPKYVEPSDLEENKHRFTPLGRGLIAHFNAVADLHQQKLASQDLNKLAL